MTPFITIVTRFEKTSHVGHVDNFQWHDELSVLMVASSTRFTQQGLYGKFLREKENFLPKLANNILVSP